MTETGKYKYIIASDLDGTLLHAKDTLSEENKAAIKKMAENGICFVPCSGRTFSEMPPVLLQYPHIRYYIGADGGAIWDKQTDERIELSMKRDSVRPIFDLLDSYDSHYSVRIKGKSYVDKRKDAEEIYRRNRYSHLYVEFIKAYVNIIDGFDEFIRSAESVEMICAFFSDPIKLEECAKRIFDTGEFNVASSEPGNIEIFHKSAGKGNALLTLADKLGVPHENTVAVGDSKNDIDMLKKAGLSLAMENAGDEIKALAHRTICHYKEHSAKYILENILGIK